MKNPILLLSILFISSGALAQKKGQKEVLDNNTFIIEMTATGSAKGKPDELLFKSGKVKTNMLEDKGGFKACTYTVVTDSLDKDEDRYIVFESMGRNDLDEDIEIKGIVIGDDIEGTAKWMKGDKPKKEYTFSGSLKKGKN